MASVPCLLKPTSVFLTVCALHRTLLCPTMLCSVFLRSPYLATVLCLALPHTLRCAMCYCLSRTVLYRLPAHAATVLTSLTESVHISSCAKSGSKCSMRTLQKTPKVPHTVSKEPRQLPVALQRWLSVAAATRASRKAC